MTDQTPPLAEKAHMTLGNAPVGTVVPQEHERRGCAQKPNGVALYLAILDSTKAGDDA